MSLAEQSIGASGGRDRLRGIHPRETASKRDQCASPVSTRAVQNVHPAEAPYPDREYSARREKKASPPSGPGGRLRSAAGPTGHDPSGVGPPGGYTWWFHDPLYVSPPGGYTWQLHGGHTWRLHDPSGVGPPTDEVPGKWALYVVGQRSYAQLSGELRVSDPLPRPTPSIQVAQSVRASDHSPTIARSPVPFSRARSDSRDAHAAMRRCTACGIQEVGSSGTDHHAWWMEKVKLGGYTAITRRLHGDYTAITRQLHGDYTAVTRRLHPAPGRCACRRLSHARPSRRPDVESAPRSTWRLHMAVTCGGYIWRLHMAVTQQLHGGYTAETRRLHAASARRPTRRRCLPAPRRARRPRVFRPPSCWRHV